MKPLEKFLKKQTTALTRAGGFVGGVADKASGGTGASRRRASLSRVVPFFRETSPESGQAREVFRWGFVCIIKDKHIIVWGFVCTCLGSRNMDRGPWGKNVTLVPKIQLRNETGLCFYTEPEINQTLIWVVLSGQSRFWGPIEFQLNIYSRNTEVMWW